MSYFTFNKSSHPLQQARLNTRCPVSDGGIVNTNYETNYAINPSISHDVNCHCASNTSPNPTAWGPHLWAYLHTMSANYPERPTSNQSHMMKMFLISLGSTIPCKQCAEHYENHIQKNMQNLDFICSSKAELFSFIVNLHNIVNERNKKPLMSQQKARQLYRY